MKSSAQLLQLVLESSAFAAQPLQLYSFAASRSSKKSYHKSDSSRPCHPSSKFLPHLVNSSTHAPLSSSNDDTSASCHHSSLQIADLACNMMHVLQDRILEVHLADLHVAVLNALQDDVEHVRQHVLKFVSILPWLLVLFWVPRFDETHICAHGDQAHLNPIQSLANMHVEVLADCGSNGEDEKWAEGAQNLWVDTKEDFIKELDLAVGMHPLGTVSL